MQLFQKCYPTKNIVFILNKAANNSHIFAFKPIKMFLCLDILIIIKPIIIPIIFKPIRAPPDVLAFPLYCVHLTKSSQVNMHTLFLYSARLIDDVKGSLL